MSSKTPKTIAFAMGTTAGGMITGLAEALYRDASLIYAMFFYGALCAMGGLLALPALQLWPKSKRPQRLGTLGASLTLFATTLVIGRFLVLRDFFAESSSAQLPATGIAAVMAVAVALAVYSTGKAFGQNFRSERLNGAPSWGFVGTVLIGFAFLASQPSSPAYLASTESQIEISDSRGVILVVADALRADALSTYGAKIHRGQPPTPSIDKWSKTSVVFDDMSAQASWTKPTMASIMTSRHVPGHQTMLKTDVVPDTLPTLAEVLTSGKVDTAAVVTNYNLEPSYGFSAGFENYRYLSPDRYLGAPEDANRLVAYNVYRLLHERYMSTSREPRFFYQEGKTVNQEAFAFLDQKRTQPFFLWLHYMEPHDPFFANDGQSYARVASPNPPANMAEIFHDAYLDDVQRFDKSFAQLLLGLEQRGLLDKIHIVLTSDHGEEFGEHGGYYHGQTLYEEMLNIPLVISGPAVTPARRSDIARQVDIAPTIASLFGIKADPTWEGRNLLGDTAAPTHTFASQNHQGQILEAARQNHPQDMKLIQANADNPRGLLVKELYNLGSDSEEKTPIQDTQPIVVQTLENELKLHQERSKTGDASRQKKEMNLEDEAELRALGYIE
jgi:arylsulfatase A-like enzyme